MDITNSIRKYVECATSGTVTEPTGGSWISALAIYQGSTTPLNASWLQRVCDNFGITQPVDGSWLIALANYYGQFTPVNGSWSYAVQVGCEAGPPAPVDLIWNNVSTQWQLEETVWATATVPTTPTFNEDNDEVGTTPTFTGTALASSQVIISVNGGTYTTTANVSGIWSTVVTIPPGSPSPGTQYTVTIVSRDLSTGVISAEFQGLVFGVQASVTYTFKLETEWSLYWYYAGIQVEKEVTAGVFQAVEWEGNPTWSNGSLFYKVQPFINAGGIPTGYSATDIMSFRQGDESGATYTGFITRDIILDLGFNYRIVGVAYNNATTNYGRFNRYTVLDGSTVILAQYDGDDVDYLTGTVQQTFTL